MMNRNLKDLVLPPAMTINIESQLQKRLLDLVEADLMPKWIYDSIRAIGSQRPRIYGRPKAHKDGAD